MSAELDEDEVCETAIRMAFRKGMEICDPDQQMQQAGRLFGISPGEPDPDCDQALEEGLNAETCGSIRGTRQWVMCRVFNGVDGEPSLLEDENGDLSVATERAWEMVDEACG